MTDVGLDRNLVANCSNQSFHSADPRMVIAFGWVPFFSAICTGFPPAFFAMMSPHPLGSHGPSIGEASARDKPGMGMTLNEDAWPV
jgi:hypothetical protein